MLDKIRFQLSSAWLTQQRGKKIPGEEQLVRDMVPNLIIQTAEGHWQSNARLRKSEKSEELAAVCYWRKCDIQHKTECL